MKKIISMIILLMAVATTGLVAQVEEQGDKYLYKVYSGALNEEIDALLDSKPNTTPPETLRRIIDISKKTGLISEEYQVWYFKMREFRKDGKYSSRDYSIGSEPWETVCEIVNEKLGIASQDGVIDILTQVQRNGRFLFRVNSTNKWVYIERGERAPPPKGYGGK